MENHQAAVNGGLFLFSFSKSAHILALMISYPETSNWLEIDLTAIDINLGIFRGTTDAGVMVVVKANGYGHGILEVSEQAEASGANYLGVARVDEAFQIRKAGISLPVLVLGRTPNDRFEEAIRREISLTIFQPDQIGILSNASTLAGKTAKIHVNVDTGMSRLGAVPDVALQMVEELSGLDGVQVEGVFTHFACADIPELPINDQQEELFTHFVDDLESSDLRPPIVHAANSSAALTRPTSHFDMIRVGVAVYGMNPSSHVQLSDEFRPALEWKSRLSAVFLLPPGRGVSYGHDYVTTKHERIGVVPVGYGDGYRRSVGNSVLVHEVRVPVIGRVCMDHIIVQLDDAPGARVGDEVVLLGSQGDLQIQLDDLANLWETINEEVVCGLSARIPRHYPGI
jgi:alanine racemase